jgi:hypothetical protein
MTDPASMDAWTPQDLDRLLLAIRSGDEERRFRRWQIRQAARCRKARRGWR